jgi:hypothetical protein
MTLRDTNEIAQKLKIIIPIQNSRRQPEQSIKAIKEFEENIY